MNYPCVSFLQKIRGVNHPEMHSVSREVRAPRIAHMLVRLCFDFLGYDFSVSKIFFEYVRMHLYWRLVEKPVTIWALMGRKHMGAPTCCMGLGSPVSGWGRKAAVCFATAEWG